MPHLRAHVRAEVAGFRAWVGVGALAAVLLRRQPVNGVQRRTGSSSAGPRAEAHGQKARPAQDRTTPRLRPRGEQAIGEALYARIRAVVKQLNRTAQGK